VALVTMPQSDADGPWRARTGGLAYSGTRYRLLSDQASAFRRPNSGAEAPLLPCAARLVSTESA
jgi:hypothetical protein